MRNNITYRNSHEQRHITKEHIAHLNFKLKPALWSSTLVIKLFKSIQYKVEILNVALLGSLVISILLLQGMPTFVTEALCLVSNIQLIKRLLLLNGWLIQFYLNLLCRNSQRTLLLRPHLSSYQWHVSYICTYKETEKQQNLLSYSHTRTHTHTHTHTHTQHAHMYSY